MVATPAMESGEMIPVLSPQEIAALTIFQRPVMLVGAGLTDAWLLFDKDGKLVDLWVRLA